MSATVWAWICIWAMIVCTVMMVWFNMKGHSYRLFWAASLMAGVFFGLAGVLFDDVVIKILASLSLIGTFRDIAKTSKAREEAVE